MKPPELAEAELVDLLCRRYGALPRAGGLLDQDAGYMMRMLGILAIASGSDGIPIAVETDEESELAALMMPLF